MWANYIRTKRGSTFQITLKDWLKMPITTCEEAVVDEDGKIITHQEYINFFIHTIKQMILSNGYKITNEKKFKEEICNFIYKISDNSRNGNVHRRNQFGGGGC